MGDHSVDRLIDDLNGLNDESEQLIDEIENMIMEEGKVDNISDKDMHYEGEEKNCEERAEKIMEQEWNDYNQAWKGIHTRV